MFLSFIFFSSNNHSSLDSSVGRAEDCSGIKCRHPYVAGSNPVRGNPFFENRIHGEPTNCGSVESVEFFSNEANDARSRLDLWAGRHRRVKKKRTKSETGDNFYEKNR